MEVKDIRFEGERIYAITDDGRELWQSLLYYRRLLHATPEQRAHYEIGAFGIHWPDVDEDISFESFEYENAEPSPLSRFFLTHPEINVSALARKIGISQSMMAQYINGLKSPSESRRQEILSAVHLMGSELAAANF